MNHGDRLAAAVLGVRCARRGTGRDELELLMGFEPMTSSLPRTCSTPEPQQLAMFVVSSPGDRPVLAPPPGVERVMGIEPTQPAWKAGALPLSYTRVGPAGAWVGRDPFVLLFVRSCPRCWSFCRLSTRAPRTSETEEMVGEAGFEPA